MKNYENYEIVARKSEAVYLDCFSKFVPLDSADCTPCHYLFKSRTWFRVLLRSNLLSFFLQGDHESTKGCLTSFRGLKATGQADR